MKSMIVAMDCLKALFAPDAVVEAVVIPLLVERRELAPIGCESPAAI